MTPSANPRVLFVAASLETGGTELHLLWLVRELRLAGFRPAVFALTPDGSLTAQFEDADIPVYQYSGSTSSRWGIAASAVALLRHLATHRYDVVHMFLPVSYLLGTPCALITSRAVRVMSRRSLNHYRRDHRLTAGLEPLFHRMTHAITGNSSAVLDDLRGEGVPENRLRLIQNGVRKVSRVSDADRLVLRQRLNLASDALVIVNVANLFAYKGHETMLEALARASDRLPSGWRALFVGRDTGIGAGLVTLAETIGIADHVVWLGPRSDPVPVLQASDVYLHGSEQEGFSNAVLEAMAAGLPVVATTAGGTPDAVLEGRTGRLVPVGDVGAMAAALIGMADDAVTRRAMGQAGRARAEDTFSEAACLAKYLALYDELLSGR